MTDLHRERFPHPKAVESERIGATDKSLCAKCGRKLDDLNFHAPEWGRRVCLPEEDGACPECGGIAECHHWCSLTRFMRYACE